MPVNDANVKVGTNTGPLNEATNGTSKLKFDIPFFNVQGMFGGLAERGAVGAKESFEKMKAASEEVSNVLHEACSRNAKGTADYGAKVLQISSMNTNATLEFLSRLADSRSLVDVVNLSIAESRKSFEAASTQNRELWELAQNLATETAEPIKKSFKRALRSAP
ncbi:MAG: phasin [Rhizomicrobium sp.]